MAAVTAAALAAVAVHGGCAGRHAAGGDGSRCQDVSRRRQRHVAEARRGGLAGRLGRAELHHRRHRSARRARHAGSWPTPTAKFAKDATRFDKVELPADQRRQLDLLKVSLVLATPADPKEAEELTQLVSRMRAHLRQGQVVSRSGEAGSVPQHRRRDEGAGHLAKREGAAPRVGRLAHDFAADEEGLRALRRAVEQGREGAGLRRHRRDVARRSTTCRPTRSPRSSIGSGIRCGRSISSCTPTCA